MATIDLTGDDDAIAETLSPHDPRRRAVIRGGSKRGGALVTEIRKLDAEGLKPSEIVERVKCSRAYVHKVLTQEPAAARIPEDLLARMVAELQRGADPAGLLDAIPEVASLFRPRAKKKTKARTVKPPTSDRDRVLASLRQLISAGGRAQEGPAKVLYEARQAGKNR